MMTAHVNEYGILLRGLFPHHMDVDWEKLLDELKSKPLKSLYHDGKRMYTASYDSSVIYLTNETVTPEEAVKILERYGFQVNLSTVRPEFDGTPRYVDGTLAKVGHVVIEASQMGRYIVYGFEGSFAKLLMIGTVIKETAPSYGETIILPTVRKAPCSVLTHLGSARINIVENDPQI